MSACERIRADAPGIASLHRDDPERVAAWSHASGCEGCARALREAERLQSLLEGWEPEPLPAEALERASREIRAQLRRDAGRRVAASVAAVCATALLFAAVAHARSRSLADWALAAALLAIASALAAAASRRPVIAASVGVAAAVAAGILSGAPGPMAVSPGAECLAIELASAAIVVGAAWLALRGGATSVRASMAGAAAAGALAGDAALQVTCAARGAIPHLLAYHAGGIVVAAVLAAALVRLPRRAVA